LEKIKRNYEKEIQKAVGQKTELKLVPDTQFMYTADFTFKNELFVGCFPISIYDNPESWHALFGKGGKEPLPSVITLGSLIEGTIPTSIITKHVKTGFMSHKRVFLPFYSELVDMSKGAFKVEPKKIYGERRGFADNPLVERLNKDKWLVDRIQKIHSLTSKCLNKSAVRHRRTLSSRIDDTKNDFISICQIVPYNKMTLVAFQSMPDWNKNKPVGLDNVADIEKRIIDYIRNYASFEERIGTVAQPWVNAFLQISLLHLKTYKPNLSETKNLLQNLAGDIS
jgi:hypothetical protein